MYSYIIEVNNYHFKNVRARVFTTQLHTPLTIRPKMKKHFVDTFQIKFDLL